MNICTLLKILLYLLEVPIFCSKHKLLPLKSSSDCLHLDHKLSWNFYTIRCFHFEMFEFVVKWNFPVQFQNSYQLTIRSSEQFSVEAVSANPRERRFNNFH